MTAKKTVHYALIVTALLALLPGIAKTAETETNDDLTEQMKQSLVFLNVTAYSYEQLQPWKQADLRDNAGYACAVGPYQLLTTAWNVADAVFIKARRYAKNEFIPATVKVIDYESNLCLLELDRNAMQKPLKPIAFTDHYRKGASLKSYWLTSGGHLDSARGYLDRAEVHKSSVSYASFLNYIAADTSAASGRAKLYCLDAKPIGIAYWADSDNQETGLIPAETINRFLEDAKDGNYNGFASVGFATRTLIDPAMRQYLKMPPDLKIGAHVAKVYTLGTASDALKENDVILAIDSKSLNAYGRYQNAKFDRVSYHHLITSHSAGDDVTFDIWRDAKKMTLTVKAENFRAEQMLVPYYEFGRQPEYIVSAGFIFQKLTHSYLQVWGEAWTGKVPPHLYHYYRDLAFMPAEDRKQIVILSYVLPADINLGYQKLGRLVVSTFNGKKISSLADILHAQKLNPDSKYDTIEFENDNPTIVIPRNGLTQTDQMIAKRYGINALINLNK